MELPYRRVITLAYSLAIQVLQQYIKINLSKIIPYTTDTDRSRTGHEIAALLFQDALDFVVFFVRFVDKLK